MFQKRCGLLEALCSSRLFWSQNAHLFQFGTDMWNRYTVEKLLIFPLAVLFPGCFLFHFSSERQRTMKLTVHFACFVSCLLIFLYRLFQNVYLIDGGMLSSGKYKWIQIVLKLMILMSNVFRAKGYISVCYVMFLDNGIWPLLNLHLKNVRPTLWPFLVGAGSIFHPSCSLSASVFGFPSLSMFFPCSWSKRFNEFLKMNSI